MTRLVALLGSINTGGNRIKMDALKAALITRGFVNVATVTASGNVLFDGDPGEGAALAQAMAACLAQDFEIDTFAVVMSSAQLEASLAENPFTDDGADNLVHVHFLEREIEPQAFEQLLADHAGRGNERLALGLALGTNALHIDYVDGVGRSKLTGPFIAKRLGCRGTARNIRSLRRILEAMG